MRRSAGLLLLLCGAVLTTTIGCACTARKEQTKEANDYFLYYEVRDLNAVQGGDAIGKEQTSVKKANAETSQQLAVTLMKRFLAGPREKRLKSPVPEKTALRSVQLDKRHAIVDLSASYGTLSGVLLSMADYCITMTLTQISNIQTVSVTVDGQELAYRDIHDFSVSDILKSDTEDVIGTVTVSLYFPNAKGELTAERRSLALYEGEIQAKAVIKALRDGPKSSKLKAVLPRNFSVHSVWVKDSVCYVSLSTAELKKISKQADLNAALQALAKSLHSLNSVNSVQYLVNGKIAGSFNGVDIGGIN